MVDYMDEQIGRVYRWLEANGELDNTLIVLVAARGFNAPGAGSDHLTPSAEKTTTANTSQ
jgi:arylsulfatase A-like enzyme